MSEGDLDDLVGHVITSSIGVRVLSSNLVISHRERRPNAAWRERRRVGVFDRRCRPAELARSVVAKLAPVSQNVYGISPQLKIEGHADAEVTWIPAHLRYILQEVFKNAMRATIEHASGIESVVAGQDAYLPPIVLALEEGPRGVTLRISDKGGGVPREALDKIWRYGFSSTQESRGPGDVKRQMAGYGFGLPLARAFARYLGGDLRIESTPDVGTTVIVDLCCDMVAREHVPGPLVCGEDAGSEAFSGFAK